MLKTLKTLVVALALGSIGFSYADVSLSSVTNNSPYAVQVSNIKDAKSTTEGKIKISDKGVLNLLPGESFSFQAFVVPHEDNAVVITVFGESAFGQDQTVNNAPVIATGKLYHNEASHAASLTGTNVQGEDVAETSTPRVQVNSSGTIVLEASA